MCGGTTAWTYTLRGQGTHAAMSNLGATLLCVVAVIGSPWLLLVAIQGRWLLLRPRLRPLLLMATVWLVVVVLDWLRRLYLEL